MKDPLRQARLQQAWREARQRTREAAEAVRRANEELEAAQADEDAKRREMFGINPEGEYPETQ